ncbi:hypothetical protein [Paenibacillus lemnae]|uniref:Uncharacterized protein n=1 Tax=Paenibacillus lemnae TaxID=1330551 RepID=A0A848M939_PAELE|nr:hypothetical protein [Paenibacillus lemnae]NMO96690.1 hypothetical protein [Paenibacillus lemnae]
MSKFLPASERQTEKTQQNQQTESEHDKHPLQKFTDRHVRKLGLLLLGGLAMCLLSFVLLDDITATVISGSFMLLFFLGYMVWSNVIAAYRAKNWKDYVFSRKMAANLFVLLIITTACYLGRNDLRDIPHYYQKDFNVFTGVPQDIDYFHATSSRGPGSSTKFLLESGEVLRYRGLIQDLDPEHAYKIEYLPHSKNIVFLTDLSTGQTWRMR